MDIPGTHDPGEPLSTAFARHIDSEQHLLSLSTLVESVSNLVLNAASQSDDPSEDENVKGIKEHIQTVRQCVGQKKEEIRKKQEILRESESLKEIRQDTIFIPLPGEGLDDWIPLEDCKKSFGVITKDNIARNLKQYLTRLFKHGTCSNFSYENYVCVLQVCFQGEMAEKLLQLERQRYTFPQMINYFYTVYCRPKDYHYYEELLNNYERFEMEPIRATMMRFILDAASADQLVPKDQMHWSTNNQKIRFLELALIGKAKVEYNQWRHSQIESGLYFDYESCFEQAERLEKKYHSLPKHNFFIRTTRQVTHNQNENSSVEQYSLFPNDNNQQQNPSQSDPNIPPKPMTYAQVAALGTKRNNSGKPVSKTQTGIDPHRSQNTRPSFYNSRTKPPAAVNQYGLQRNTFGPPPRKMGRRENVRNSVYRRSASNGNPNNPNNPRSFQASRMYSSSNNQARTNYRNPQTQPSYPSNGFRGNSSNRGNPNRYRGRSLPPRLRRNFGNSNSSNEYRGQNQQQRNGYYPSQRRNGENSAPRQNSTRIGQVRKGWFCLKCGIDISNPESTKNRGSDHMTETCRVYPLWNPNYCEICIKRNIKANHWSKHCLSNSKESSELRTSK